MIRHSLNDAINQLRNIRVPKKKARTSLNFTKSQNMSSLYKSDNIANKNNNSSNATQIFILPTQSDPNSSKPLVRTRRDLDFNKTVPQGKTNLTVIFPSQAITSKFTKSMPPKPPDDPKISINIHPPESKSEIRNVREPNPRFVSNSNSPQSVKNASPPSPRIKKVRRNLNVRVSFDRIFQKKLSQSKIDLYYRFGLRLLKESHSQRRAARYIKFAADQGNVHAIARYGQLLYDGSQFGMNRKIVYKYRAMRSNNYGVKRNRREAARYFKMAADLGDVKSMRKYRSMLYDGDGIEKDRKTAASYYKIDADQGDVASISQYATMLYLGDGVDKDLNEAVRYFKLAVDKGDRFAIRMFAYLYQTGNGVELNLKEAMNFYKLAAELGDDVSVKQIVKLIDIGCGIYMTKMEIEKYREMAARIRKT